MLAAPRGPGPVRPAATATAPSPASDAAAGGVKLTGTLLQAANDGHLEEVATAAAKLARLLQTLQPAAVDDAGRSALHSAAAQGHARAVESLLQLGLKPLDADRDGQTPLMLAIKNGHPGVASVLLQALSQLEERTAGESFVDTALVALSVKDRATLEKMVKMKWWGLNFNNADDREREQKLTRAVVAAGPDWIQMIAAMPFACMDLPAAFRSAVTCKPDMEQFSSLSEENAKVACLNQWHFNFFERQKAIVGCADGTGWTQYSPYQRENGKLIDNDFMLAQLEAIKCGNSKTAQWLLLQHPHAEKRNFQVPDDLVLKGEREGTIYRQFQGYMLQFAALHGNADIVDMLLETKHLNEHVRGKEFVLNVARNITEGVGAMGRLLDIPKIKADKGLLGGALAAAAEEGNVDMVKLLLTQHPKDVKAVSKSLKARNAKKSAGGDSAQAAPDREAVMALLDRYQPPPAALARVFRRSG